MGTAPPGEFTIDIPGSRHVKRIGETSRFTRRLFIFRNSHEMCDGFPRDVTYTGPVSAAFFRTRNVLTKLATGTGFAGHKDQ